ncbi:MAG: M56 family metallopeptidase [Bacteroidota bacterium]
MLFILTTTLLSFMLWGIYLLFLRSSKDLWVRKTYLYFLVGSITLLGIYTLYLTILPALQTHTTSVWSQIPVEVLREFCHCQNPTYKHEILYQSQVLFSYYESAQPWVQPMLWIGFILSMLHTLRSCLSLHRLSRTHKGESKRYEERVFSVIPTHQESAVGVFSWGRDFLIWPSNFQQLAPQQQQAILAHEASHLAQKNTLELIFLSIIRSISWFNPIYYLLRKELVLISEFTADSKGAEVLQSPLTYARLILSLQKEKVHTFIQHLRTHALRERIYYLLESGEKGGNIRNIWMAYLFGISLLWASAYSTRYYAMEYQKFSHLAEQIDQSSDGGFSCDGCVGDLREFRRVFKTEQGTSPGLSTPANEGEG